MLAVLSLLLAATAPAAEPGYEERLVAWGLEQQPGRVLEPEPLGKPIEEVLVSAEDVFSESDPWPRLLNIFHARTRESVIRREVLLSVGEGWDPTRIEETERNLRRLFIFAVAKIVPVKGRAGGVALLVVTKDRWSLRLNSDFNLVGNLLQLLRLRPTEQNFLGRNEQVLVDFLLKLDTLQISQEFVDQRLFGTRLSFGESAGIVFNRQTSKPEGTSGSVEFGRPLVSLDQQWAFDVQGDWNVRRRRIFRGASVWQLPYPDDSGSATVPFVYDVREFDAQASITRSFGTKWKAEVSGAIGGYGRRYTAPAESALTADENAWFQQNYLPRSEDANYLLAYFRGYRADFRVLKNIDTFELSEDFQLGPLVQLGARWALPVFNPNHFIELGGAVRYRWLARDDLLTVTLAGAARLVPGGPTVNRHLAGEVKNASPPFEGGRLVTRVVFDVIGDDLNNRSILLGGGNGLRGAPAELLSGRNLFLANIEYRTRAFEVQTFYVGFVLFYDAGSAFDARLNLTHTLGLGLRILLPQFNQEAIRIDFGFVIGGDGRAGADRFSATFGQVTDIRPDFLDQPL